MTSADSNSGPPGPGGDPTVLPPLVADPLFVEAVDDAIAGDGLADSPEAQPGRRLTGVTDFSSLYIRHRSSFGLHARRFLHDQRDIDEVVQETFLRLFLALPEIETELQALAFSRRTLTNLCIDRYRRDVRRPRLVDLDDYADDLGDDASYDDPILRAEDAAVVREALALLSPLHREALVKREIEEKSLPTIAAELEIPEESVKHVLFRARRALRRLLVGSTVDPATDLSVGAVLGAGAHRFARASATGMKSLLVLIIGLVVSLPLLRNGGPVTQTSLPAPNRVLPSGPDHLVTPSTPGAGLVDRPGHRDRDRNGIPAKVSKPASQVRSGTVPVDSSEPRDEPRPPVTDGHDQWSSDPTPPPHHHGGGNPPPVQPPDDPPFSITGAYAGTASLQQSMRLTRPDGTTASVAALAADTAAGPLAINQSLSLGPDLETHSASVSIAVPVPAGQVGYVVEPSVFSATRKGDGSVLVVVDGSATQVGSIEGQTAGLTQITATIHLDADLVEVLDERVVLGGEVPAPTAPDDASGDTPGVGSSDTTGHLPLNGAGPDYLEAITALPKTTR